MVQAWAFTRVLVEPWFAEPGPKGGAIPILRNRSDLSCLVLCPGSPSALGCGHWSGPASPTIRDCDVCHLHGLHESHMRPSAKSSFPQLAKWVQIHCKLSFRLGKLRSGVTKTCLGKAFLEQTTSGWHFGMFVMSSFRAPRVGLSAKHRSAQLSCDFGNASW